MVLVDANVLLDVLTEDGHWFEWSSGQLVSLARQGLAINPIIYAELAAGYSSSVALDRDINEWGFERLNLPYVAAYLAGHSFLEYRRRGGGKSTPLPDFFIGAHALVEGHTLLTRDATRYRSYFPRVKLIAPK